MAITAPSLLFFSLFASARSLMVKLINTHIQKKKKKRAFVFSSLLLHFFVALGCRLRPKRAKKKKKMKKDIRLFACSACVCVCVVGVRLFGRRTALAAGGFVLCMCVRAISYSPKKKQGGVHDSLECRWKRVLERGGGGGERERDHSSKHTHTRHKLAKK
jgi:hypothetical protein